MSCHHKTDRYDVILTSPPYGDSRTTVAYGQFSLFANAWLLEQSQARAIDSFSLRRKKMSRKKLIIYRFGKQCNCGKTITVDRLRQDRNRACRRWQRSIGT